MTVQYDPAEGIYSKSSFLVTNTVEGNIKFYVHKFGRCSVLFFLTRISITANTRKMYFV